MINQDLFLGHDLTKEQAKVLYYIRKYMYKHKIAPTIEEIQTDLGFATMSRVRSVIKVLMARDYITKVNSVHRSITLLK